MKEEKIPSNLVVFNYKSNGKAMPSVDDVPTLVKDAVLKELQANDTNPFYKIEAIDYPVNGSGGVYEASFFTLYSGAVTREKFTIPARASRINPELSVGSPFGGMYILK